MGISMVSRLRMNHCTYNRFCPSCMNSGLRSYCILQKNLFHEDHICNQCSGFVDISNFELPEDWEKCEVCNIEPIVCRCSYCPREICTKYENHCTHPTCYDESMGQSLYTACKKCYGDHKRKIHHDIPTPEKQTAKANATRLKKKTVGQTKRQPTRFAGNCGHMCEDCITEGFEVACVRGNFHPGKCWCPRCHKKEGCGVCEAKHEMRKACDMICGKRYCFYHLSE